MKRGVIVARSKIALFCAIASILLIFSTIISASTTVKETTVVIQMGMPKLLLSLSSISILALPLVLACITIASIALLSNNKNVAMLFLFLGLFFCISFVFFFLQEKANSTLYMSISEALKEASVSFKKRDIKSIKPSLSIHIYIAIALLALSLLSLHSVLQKENRHMLKKDLLPYAYIAPHLFFFVIFFVTPALYGIYVAFTKWDLFNEPVFTGLENFKNLLIDSNNTYYKQLRNGLWNTIQFVLYSVPFCILIPLSLALALNVKNKGNKILQAIYYFPSLMSITTVTLSWRYFFNFDYGVMNKFFGSTANWFTPPYSWAMVVVVTVWWVAGGTMVIYQSALASIPQDQYEAAAVDGAGKISKFFHVTLPNMRYPLMYTFIMSVIAQFNIFGQPDILLGFRNQEANAVLLMYIHENAVKKQVAGISSAMAVILGLCIMIVTIFQMRVLLKYNRE